MPNTSHPRDPFDPKKPEVLSEATWLVGHDLKQVLTMAEAHVEQLHRHVPPSEPASRELSGLRRTLAEADELAETLLEAHRVHGVERWAIDLTAFLTQRETSIRESVDPAVAVTFKLYPTMGMVVANESELEEILRRLISNAIRSMPSGGDLTITTGWLDHVPSGAPREPARPKRYARLTVCDTGPEPEEDAPSRLLAIAGGDDRLTNVDDDVATLVRRLGGWIILEGEDGDGTRVHVCLPSIADV